MKLRTISAVLLVSILATFAAAQNSASFSADMKSTMGKEKMVSQGKMYYGGTKFRMETNTAGHQSIMISDLPTKTVYVLMPEQRMYMEMKADSMPGGKNRQPSWKPYDASNPCANEPGVTCKKVGTEIFDGRLCDKWQFTGKGGERMVWIDQKSHIPTKTVASDMTIEITNIKEGPQPASLFELPAGYQKFSMGGMFRGLRPQMNQE